MSQKSRLKHLEGCKKELESLKDQKPLPIPNDVLMECLMLEKNMKKQYDKCNSVKVIADAKISIRGETKRKINDKRKAAAEAFLYGFNLFNKYIEFYADNNENFLLPKLKKAKKSIEGLNSKLISSSFYKNNSSSIKSSSLELDEDKKATCGLKGSESPKNYKEAIEKMAKKVEDGFNKAKDVEEWGKKIKEKVRTHDNDESINLSNTISANIKEINVDFDYIKEQTGILVEFVENTEIKGKKYKSELNGLMPKVMNCQETVDTAYTEFKNFCRRYHKYGEYINKDKSSGEKVMVNFSPLMESYSNLALLAKKFTTILSQPKNVKSINTTGSVLCAHYNAFSSNYSIFQKKFIKNNEISFVEYKFQNYEGRIQTLEKVEKQIYIAKKEIGKLKLDVQNQDMDIIKVYNESRKEYSFKGRAKKVGNIILDTISVINQILSIVRNIVTII